MPPRSALWLDARGRRFGPVPLMGYTDTRWVVEQICRTRWQYSWQVLNWKIAIKELAVSGCDYMTAFRHKRKLELVKQVVFGNTDLANRLIDSVEALVGRAPDQFMLVRNSSEAEQARQKGLLGLAMGMTVVFAGAAISLAVAGGLVLGFLGSSAWWEMAGIRPGWGPAVTTGARVLMNAGLSIRGPASVRRSVERLWREAGITPARLGDGRSLIGQAALS